MHLFNKGDIIGYILGDEVSLFRVTGYSESQKEYLFESLDGWDNYERMRGYVERNFRFEDELRRDRPELFV